MRVLVVEDDRALGAVVVRGLAEEGHAVDLVATALDARHAVATVPYDAVVLDLGLPDGDGTDVCRQMREQGNMTPVLMLTARDEIVDTVRGLDSGADDYLTKPFHFAELTARVRALLRRPPKTVGATISVGDVTVDPAAHVASRAGMPVALTAREFSLLDFLARRAGSVVTRSELIDHVWDGDYDGLSNVVDVHVANLRRKLALPGRGDPIETIRGVGYRIAPRDEPPGESSPCDSAFVSSAQPAEQAKHELDRSERATDPLGPSAT
jgi:two-component system OmpR family response regulator